MKIKVFASLFVCLLIHFSHLNAQTILGIKAGAQVSKMSGFIVDTDMLSAFQIKGISRVKLNRSLLLTPSIGYSGKGFVFKNLDVTDENGTTIGSADAHYLFNYLQLSVPFAYSFQLKNENAISVGIGPYFAYSMSGKGKLKHTTGETPTNSFDPFSDDTYRRTDAGFVLEVDGTFKNRFLISLNLDLGVANVVEFAGNKIRNNAAGISIGYLFRK